MSIKKKLFSNTISNGLQFGSRWIMNILLAQNTGISAFGIFSFIYTMATLIATFFTFGSNLYILNNIRISEKSSLSYLYTSLAISTFFFAIFFLLLFIFDNFILLNSSYKNYFLYALLLAFIWSINMNLFSFFKGLGLFENEAKAYLVFSILLLSLLGILNLNHNLNMIKLQWIFLSLIGLNLIPTIIGIINLKNLFPISINAFIQKIKIFMKSIKESLKQRFSYGIHELQSILFSNLPFLMIGILVSSEDLGQYRAIYILIVPLLILPVIISQVLLNQLTYTKTDMPIYKMTFRKFSLYTLIIGLLIMIFYLLFGTDILNTIYKNKFSPKTSVPLLSIFVITAFLWFIKSNYEVLLTSLGKQWLRVKVLWIVLILYPILIFILPEYWAILKYAIAGLITTLFMLLTYIFFAEIELKNNLKSTIHEK